MTQTTARIKRGGKNFEILIDLDEAIKVKNDKGNINAAVITNAVFHNLKSGEQASTQDLKKFFDTDVFENICLKIIKNGEIEFPKDYLKAEQDKKYKQVVDFLIKNAVDQHSRPFTPQRIMKALEEAHVNVKNKPIDSQISEIIEQLQKILPMKIEMKKLSVSIPAQYTGKAYGIIHEYLEKEDWLSNGDLQATLNMPSAMVFDFYDKLNAVTHGSALSEEIKKS
ncbi:MAG: ribosome assembly factor SBDS [Nanoarchaeota archaeon]|nr:ribosome assembly factor SBDS [Nanoarchaeota archaeon]